MSKPRRARLADEIVAEVRRLLAEGRSQREIARMLDGAISRQSVQNIQHGRWCQKPIDPDQPKRVAYYICRGCRNKVNLTPCQVCIAMAAERIETDTTDSPEIRIGLKTRKLRAYQQIRARKQAEQGQKPHSPKAIRNKYEHIRSRHSHGIEEPQDL